MRILSVMGHGVDVVKITRFERMIARHGDVLSKFVRRLGCRILNGVHEMPRFNQLVAQKDTVNLCRYLAGNWAMKEAIYKSLDSQDQQTFQFQNWYKTYDERGKPQVGADGYRNKDEKFTISISHDEEVLIASVIRQGVYTLSVKDQIDR